MDFTSQLMSNLNGWLEPLLTSQVFLWILASVIFLNPLALLPQVVNVFRKKVEDLNGVSLPMFWIFITVQIAFALNGILTESFSAFASMAISAFQSATILFVVSRRRRRGF